MSPLPRRAFLQSTALAGSAALGWRAALAAQADDLRRRGKACILLYMQGGPSQLETFDPKPGHTNGGETKDIPTAVPGIRIAAGLPRTAAALGEVCVFRSLTGKEGSHPRATYLVHTGYLPTAAVKHPTIGSHAAHQLGNAEADLPSFVRIGLIPSAGTGGLLGVQYDPFLIQDPRRMPDNTRSPAGEARFQRRLELLGRADEHFAAAGAGQEARDHRTLYDKAARMVVSPEMQAFDVSREPAEDRALYGESPFGAGCLLARRLVEAGVTCIEVSLNGWDTHQDNFTRSAALCEQLDQPLAALLGDLKQRGLLDTTLVAWFGEFGRTPRINPRAGRDHYPRAFSAALAGCGIRGGQVIGATTASGEEVAERPVSVQDYLRTAFRALGIDADQENVSPIGRPIKVVEEGKIVEEAFG